MLPKMADLHKVEHLSQVIKALNKGKKWIFDLENWKDSMCNCENVVLKIMILHVGPSFEEIFNCIQYLKTKLISINISKNCHPKRKNIRNYTFAKIGF